MRIMLSGLFHRYKARWCKRRRPTLLLRCLLLIAIELMANAMLWMVAAIVFRHESRFLSLCLLAWTLGLRHALDADHISVIDNATRRIVSCPREVQNNNDHFIDGTADRNQFSSSPGRNRRPVTCGLWFSLGHSTIVVGVICAVSISLSVVDRLGGVSSIGGVVGASVSGATLFLFAIINSVLLIQSIRNIKAAKQTNIEKVTESSRQVTSDTEAREAGTAPNDHRFRGIFTRLAYPLFRLVDSPYKLYPIGVLFGLGFDTASSIALLGVAGATNTQAQTDQNLDSATDGSSFLPAETQANTSNASIILLALLFTAGMTLVDCVDSVLMVNAYATGELLLPPCQPARSKNWFSRVRFFERESLSLENTDPAESNKKEDQGTEKVDTPDILQSNGRKEQNHTTDSNQSPVSIVSDGSSTRLSHVLTLLSIILAFAISVITIMGLIGEHCDRCVLAASKQNESSTGGLEGRWWLFWQQANDASGLIGACIVGGFAAILATYYVIRASLTLYENHIRASTNDKQ